MAMGSANPGYLAGRLEELEQENTALREQVRRLSVQQTVTRGAVVEAAQERAVTERLAHQVAVEERATRTAVEVQGNTIGFGVILQILNFLMLFVLIFGIFVWLPRDLASRATSRVVLPNGTVTVK